MAPFKTGGKGKTFVKRVWCPTCETPLFKEAKEIIEGSVQEVCYFSLPIRNILRSRLPKKFYTTKVASGWQKAKDKARISACKEFLSEKAILKRVWFSDESWIYADGIVQNKNGYYWARNVVTPIEIQLVPLKVNVWAAVSEKGLFGPYFFHKNSKNIPVNNNN